MVLQRRAIQKFKKFNVGISYKIADDKLYDAQNVYNNKDITETRFGIARWNDTSLAAPILSQTFFKNDAGDRYLLAKVGTVLYKVNASGAATSIKTGLTSSTKHRAVTLNNRHIIAIETDGLFSYDGTTFTQLGQAVPSTGSCAIVAGGTLTATNTYQVALTFYASTIGFETNAEELSTIATTADRTIRVSSIPGSADNALIDYVRVYLKDVTAGGSYKYVTQIAIGTTTYDISAPPTSTQTIPTTHGAVTSGGGKYITTFGKRIAYAGNNSYKSDVFISEEFLPDAFDGTSTSKTLFIEGQGPITGIACGTFSDASLDPYLVIFKKNSTTIYSEIGGISRQSQLDGNIGCVSNETIKVINGTIFFLSETGWFQIFNGTMLKDKTNNPVPLGNGGVDDIFARTGWSKGLNRAQFANYFSCIYSTHRQYWTFVVEGSETSFMKAYVYERDIEGFRTFVFKTAFTSACEGEDASGNQVVFLSDSGGRVYTYSLNNDLHDVDTSNSTQTIPAFLILPFTLENDINSTYNYRFLTVRALTSDNAVTGKAFYNWDQSTSDNNSFDFSSDDTGFILDTSQLDVDSFGNERSIAKSTIDINRTADTVMFGFYQDIEDANIGLVSAQLEYNKNGNANT